MPPMPVYYVGKGTQFRVLDKFDGTDRLIYDDTVTLLEGNKTLGQITDTRAADNVSGLSEDDAKHFKNDWLGTWWPELHVEVVLRAGILKAIKTALPNSRHGLLPIEALWVCSEERVFQVYVNEGPRQVTVIVYTPPPKMTLLPHDLEELIWVVKIGDEHDAKIDGEITVLAEVEDRQLIERQLRFAHWPAGS